MDSTPDMQSGFHQKLLCRSILGAEAAVAWTAIQPLSLPSPCIQIQEDKSTPHSLVSGTDPRWCSIHTKDPLHCIATKIICIHARPRLNFSASYLSLHRPICPRFVFSVSFASFSFLVFWSSWSLICILFPLYILSQPELINISPKLDISHATHCKKGLAIFLSPAGMSLTKLSLAGKKLNYSRTGRVWSVTSRLGTGKRLTLFYSAFPPRIPLFIKRT